MALHNVEPKVNAILEAWQPGIQGWNAVVNLLFGDYSPSGKLPITFPRVTGQIPIYYNYRQSGRPQYGKYQYIATTPLYTFGDGLSYTQFKIISAKHLSYPGDDGKPVLEKGNYTLSVGYLKSRFHYSP